MIQLLVATTNRGKQREFRDLLAGWPAQIVFPQEAGIDIDVAETGRSFAEIAAQKAITYARAGQMLALADDSGLQVDALDGAPGIYTARYAGPEASDRDRYQKLLAALKETPWERRTARFRAAIALAQPGGEVQIVEGICEGMIGWHPQGENGFGYDPVFYLPEYGCTMAQLGDAIKNQISHRARAVQAALILLDELLAQHLN
ncbi:MAG: RdgB/HAM1 family non-canonical purine NTP pyrophosphatase [Anaerolineae bacterium]|nr:RdgB/HAM1 family non-canonical purine NTP pyrophosphatase [Anaerolineae bacterium]